MTDDPKNLDRILTSAEEEAVRRELAAARHTEPMPADVASRLDGVLAGLQTERSERSERDAAPESNVVPLASRRRYRIAQGIVAAAAVVAVGVGVTQVFSNLGRAGDDDSGTSFSGDSADAGAAEEKPRSAASPSGEDELAAPETQAHAKAPEIRSESFEDDVARLTPVSGTRADLPRDSQLRRLTERCAPTSPPAGHDALRVRYDDQPGLLVFRTPIDGKQRVDLYLCATGVRERSATVNYP